ncbi:hypothetical protein D3C83_118630 [compost metagenome]
MKLAEGGEDVLAKPQRGRSARMPGLSGAHIELQIGDRRACRFEQGEHLGLGVECIEALGLARLPAARLALA